MTPQDEREAIARVIDPVAFKAWQASYDYSIAAGDTVEEATAQADWSQKKPCDEALVKADAILALRQPGAEYRRGVEACASWLEGDGPDRDNGGPCRHVEHVQDYCTCRELAACLRLLPDTKGEGRG